MNKRILFISRWRIVLGTFHNRKSQGFGVKEFWVQILTWRLTVTLRHHFASLNLSFPICKMEIAITTSVGDIVDRYPIVTTAFFLSAQNYLRSPRTWSRVGEILISVNLP